MHRLLCLISFLLGVACGGRALAHGFRIDIDGNRKLQLHSDDPQAGARLIYEVQTMLGPAAFKSNDHPGYDVDTLNGANGFSLGDSIRFDTLGKLWYSSGSGVPAPSPSGVNMVITNQDSGLPGSVTVTGTSGFQNGFLIGSWDGVELGTFEHQLNYEIDVPSGVPIGAYALAMRLTGNNAAEQAFVPSAPFVIVFNNGLPIANFPAVADQMYAAAMPVPEPSSLVLAAIGLCFALLTMIRRSRNKDRCWAIARFLVASFATLALPGVASGHGLLMTFDVDDTGNYHSSFPAYYGATPDPVDHHDSVFLSGSYTVNNVATPSLQFTASYAPADRPPPNGSGHIAVGSTYAFDVVGPLLFWDPVLGVTPTNLTATIVRSGAAITVDKNSVFVSGLNLTTLAAPYNGNAGFHNSTTVNLPVGAAPGLYAIPFHVRSTNSTPYGASNAFWAIGTNGLSDNDFSRGIQAFNAIGVPEPSSMLLLAIGGFSIGIYRRLARETKGE